MSSFDNKYDRSERETFAPIESLIRAAGGYIRPTDDLRPSTLEAVRSSCRRRRWDKLVGGIALVVLLLAVCDVPGRFIPAIVEASQAETTVMREFELRQQAAKGTGLSFNPSWAFFEAFWELRTQQAELIND